MQQKKNICQKICKRQQNRYIRRDNELDKTKRTKYNIRGIWRSKSNIQKIRQSKKQDREIEIQKTLDKELDLRDRWAGIRSLQKHYQPMPYHQKNKEGKHIKRDDRAEEAAKYWATEIWKNSIEQEDEEFSKEQIHEGQKYNIKKYNERT